MQIKISTDKVRATLRSWLLVIIINVVDLKCRTLPLHKGIYTVSLNCIIILLFWLPRTSLNWYKKILLWAFYSLCLNVFPYNLLKASDISGGLENDQKHCSKHGKCLDSISPNYSFDSSLKQKHPIPQIRCIFNPIWYCQIVFSMYSICMNVFLVWV